MIREHRAGWPSGGRALAEDPTQSLCIMIQSMHPMGNVRTVLKDDSASKRRCELMDAVSSPYGGLGNVHLNGGECWWAL